MTTFRPSKRERNAIYRSVGEALNAWSTIEWELEWLMGRLLETSPARGHVIMASVVSFKARIQICNNLMAVELMSPETRARWANLYNRMSKKLDKRNELAHFTITETLFKGVYKSVLVPYMSFGSISLNFIRAAREKTGPTQQMMGLTADQIDERRDDFKKLAAALSAFGSDFIFERDTRRAALAQADDPPLASDNPDDQTPTESELPPRS